ncbi:MAG: BatA domain-containing protein [Agriterribacter sp.]
MKKGENIKRIIVTLVYSFCATCLFAQSGAVINATLKQPQLLMGDQTQLVVQIKTTVDKPITQWFNLPDTFNHIEIVSRSPVDSSLEGNTKIYNQSFTVTGFDSGVWVIPPLVIHAGNVRSSSAPLELTIIAATLSDSTYHDIRDIIEVPQEKTPWWYWALVILAVILPGILAWLWWKQRKQKPAVAIVNKPSLPLLEETLQRLSKLKAQNLPAKAEWKKYYTELTDIFKTYNEGKFHDGSLQRTTDELLMTVNQRLSKDLLSELAETLRIADAVKFAKYQPDITRSTTDIDIIEKNVKKLDRVK